MGPHHLKLVPRNAAGDAATDPAAAAVSPGTEEGAVALGGAAAPASATAMVARLADAEHAQRLRIVEAVLFAASEPIGLARIGEHLPEGVDVAALIAELQAIYAPRGINLVSVAGKWAFRTAEDLSFLLQRYAVEERRLSKAALETLSIVAYHQPVTRAEIEEIRGVSTSSGTIDLLLETGWIRPRGRRRAPGRPVTYGTTESFLSQFGLDSIKDLPGLAELKGAGLLDSTLPPGFTVPEPCDVAALMPDEMPLEAVDDEVIQGELSLDDAEPSAEDTSDEAPLPDDDVQS